MPKQHTETSRNAEFACYSEYAVALRATTCVRCGRARYVPERDVRTVSAVLERELRSEADQHGPRDAVDVKCIFARLRGRSTPARDAAGSPNLEVRAASWAAHPASTSRSGAWK